MGTNAARDTHPLVSHVGLGGATQELKAEGAKDARIKAAGRWSAIGPMAYATTQLTVAAQISRVCATSTFPGSQGCPDAPANVAFPLSLHGVANRHLRNLNSTICGGDQRYRRRAVRSAGAQYRGPLSM